MWRIRRFEERVGELKRRDEVHGLIHLSIGQEAVAAAVCGQLRDDDAVYSGHRAHGHAIAKGAPLERVLAELMGRAGGLCQGLGGSMHLVDVEHGFLGATGVVGGNIPMAVGSALAARLRGTDQVAVVFFGDGAAQAGHFTEAVNLARAVGAAGGARVREQRLRGVHAALGAHDDRARQRRGRTVRASSAKRSTGTTWRPCGTPSAASSNRPAPAAGRSCSSALRTGCAATTRATRRPTARRSPRTSGSRRTRSCGSSATALDAGLDRRGGRAAIEREAAAAVEAAEQFARASPFPPPELRRELVYA